MAAGIHEIEMFRSTLEACAPDGPDDLKYAKILMRLSAANLMPPENMSGFLRKSNAADLETYVRDLAPVLQKVLFPLKAFEKHGRSWYPFLQIVPTKSDAMGAINAIESLHVLMFSLDPEDEDGIGERSEIVGIGLRFEPPHMAPTTTEANGMHDYFHAQFINNLGRGRAPLKGIPEWLPVWQPAIPLPKSNSGAQFLLCAVLSLYGLSFLLEKLIPRLDKSAQTAGQGIVQDLLDRAGRPSKPKRTPRPGRRRNKK